MFSLRYYFEQTLQTREFPTLEEAQKAAWTLTKTQGVYLVSLLDESIVLEDRYDLLERVDALDVGHERQSHE